MSIIVIVVWSIEQEPTHMESDLDEEGDIALSLETETGLLTNPNQHAKGIKNWLYHPHSIKLFCDEY